MNIDSYIEGIDASNLNDQRKFRLNEIFEIEDYSNPEIQERKVISKYIAAFDYFDKVLITLSATSEEVSIISFANVIGAPAGIAIASFTHVFSLTAGIIKKLLQITRNKKRDIIRLLCLLKVN